MGGTPRGHGLEALVQHDEIEVVPQRLAKPVVAVGEGDRLTGLRVAAAFVPGYERGADIKYRHADRLAAVVAGEVFGGGEQRAA